LPRGDQYWSVTRIAETVGATPEACWQAFYSGGGRSGAAPRLREKPAPLQAAPRPGETVKSDWKDRRFHLVDALVLLRAAGLVREEDSVVLDTVGRLMAGA
jgi:hypothetical protein